MAAITATAKRASGTPKPILTDSASKAHRRRPTLRSKRDVANLDDETTSPPSSPSKKARVAFNNEVEVKILGPWSKSAPQVREEVHRALEQYARGDKWEYESLKEIFNPTTEDSTSPSPTVIRSYPAAIACHASKLGRAYAGLVRAMLHSDWIVRDSDYVALFQRFLADLTSTQGIWLSDVLVFLVEMLKKSMIARLEVLRGF